MLDSRRMQVENAGGGDVSDGRDSAAVRLGATKINDAGHVGVSTSSLLLHTEHSHQQQGSPFKEPDHKAFNHFHVKDQNQPRRNRQAADDGKTASHMQQVCT